MSQRILVFYDIQTSHMISSKTLTLQKEEVPFPPAQYSLRVSFCIYGSKFFTC